MNSTTYQGRAPHLFPAMRAKAYQVRDEGHPVREEIEKCLGTHTLCAIVEEDMQTLSTMKHLDGLVAFLCTLTKNGQVIAQGRGSAVLSPTNRFIQRAVGSAFNSALADAAIRATKVLDTFRDRTGDAIEESYVSEPATEKQREYLRQLILMNIQDDSEQDRLVEQIGEMTKDEASRAIESFKK